MTITTISFLEAFIVCVLYTNDDDAEAIVMSAPKPLRIPFVPVPSSTLVVPNPSQITIIITNPIVYVFVISEINNC